MGPVPMLLVVIASTLVDAAVASLFLFLTASRGEDLEPSLIGPRRLLRAALATSLFVAVKLTILSMFGLHVFGWIHVLYIDLVVLVPALGTALLAASFVRSAGQPWLRLTPWARVAAFASLAMIPIGVDATWIEPFQLRTETARVPVPPRRAGRGVIRIGVITDLQTTRVADYERSAIDRLMAEKPDVILLPGDVFQGTAEQFEATRDDLRELLGRLSAPGGVFLVLGDTDGGGGHLVRQILPSTQVRLIWNHTVRVNVGDRQLTIGGVELRFDSRQAQEVVEELESADGEDDIRILLSHRPDVALGLNPRSRVDLVVAGHTHGGQIVIPGFGPPMTLSRVPRTVAAGGLHAIKDNAIYVSRGVGCERGQAPRIRFFCPPEISLLEVGVSVEE